MRVTGMEGYVVGVHHAREGGLFDEVLSNLGPVAKVASIKTPDDEAIQKMAFDMGLSLKRVAGNVYEHPATRDFWAVKGGKLVRLTGATTEVDDGESLDPADIDDPEGTLNSILADLEF